MALANDAPEVFTASVGGTEGTSYSVELRDGIIFYSDHAFDPKASQARIKVSAEDWREFRKSLDNLKVWDWRPDYPNPGNIKDGTQWAVTLQFADRKLVSKGDNNYPDASGKPVGKPDCSESFNAFLAAVKKLIGGREFQ